MADASLFSTGERPTSVGEWEELLLRLELGPRALRTALEIHGVTPERVEPLLVEAVGREERAARALEEMRLGADAAPAPGASGGGELLDRFVSLRARTFAMVQRRGLEVWDWKGAGAAGDETAYRLLLALVAADGALLAAVRGSAAAC